MFNMGQKKSSKNKRANKKEDQDSSSSESDFIILDKLASHHNTNNPKQEKRQSSLDSQNFRKYESRPTLRRNNTETQSTKKKKRSSSVTVRNLKYSDRKRRTNSTLGESEMYPHLKKPESCNSLERTRKTMYSAHMDNRPTRNSTNYWVHTELQYVIVLPAYNESERLSELKRIRNLQKWEPHSFKGKELGPQEKESFSSITSSESDLTPFTPRSLAKPAQKPKGRFCCAKRQDS